MRAQGFKDAQKKKEKKKKSSKSIMPVSTEKKNPVPKWIPVY